MASAGAPHDEGGVGGAHAEEDRVLPEAASRNASNVERMSERMEAADARWKDALMRSLSLLPEALGHVPEPRGGARPAAR